MRLAGHDLRLLAAASAGWGVLAGALALGASPVAVLAAGLGLALASTGLEMLGGRWSPGRPLALAAAAGCLVMVAAAGHLTMQQRGPVRDLAAQRASGTFVGVVTAGPRAVSTDTDRVAGTPPRYVVAVTLEQVDARGMRSQVSTPAVVIADARWRSVTWRSRIEVRGRLAPSKRTGPAQAVLAARGAPRVLEEPSFLVGSLERLRHGLTTSMSGLPADPAGLVPALVVGDVSKIPAQLDADMSATGMSHLNAVSGSNVTIVLVAVIWCLSWVGLARLARTVGAVSAVGVYVLLCHPDPSVVRAAAMGIVGLLGTSWGRPRAACPSLGAAVVLLLLWDPWLAVSPGFALSALATLGLILFARPWAQVLTRRLPPAPPSWVARGVEMCLIPVAAQVLCLPVLVCLSGSVSLVSLPANVIAEPFVAPATLAGMGVLLVTPVWPGGAGLAAWTAGLPAWAIAAVAHVAADVPGGSIPWPSGASGVIAAVVVVAALLFAWRVVPWLGARGWTAVGGITLLPLSLLAPVPGQGAADPAWSYSQCDVGQGDAALVRTGPHSAVAVDVGPADADLTGCLERHGVSRLDALILTHFHADHVGGLSAVLDQFGSAPVFTTWIMTGVSSERGRGEKDALQETRRVLEKHRIESRTLAPGQQVRAGDVVFDVIWPRRRVTAGSAANNASLVLDVTAPRLHALLLGDVEVEAQTASLADVTSRAERRRYDVVKVAHHGSANQSAALYRAAGARYGLIGVGADNDYGHPKPALLALLEESGTAAYRTDRSGDLDVVPVGTAVTIEPQR